MTEPFHSLKINWDFDQETKNSFFNPVISSTGNDLFISICDSMKPFYEVSGCSGFNICISEIYQNKSIFLNSYTKPFIYIKNIGCSDAIFIASHSGFSGQFFDYDSLKISGTVNSNYCNYKIGPNQSFILTIHGNSDGVDFCSSGYYPFGFYYNFNNITGINLNSEFPACDLNSKSIFLYEKISGIEYQFVDTGTCNLNIESLINLSYDKPPSESKESLFFKQNSYLVSECSNLFNASCEKLTFETWFKIKDLENQDCIDIAGICDKYYLNLLAVDKSGSLSAGTCYVSEKNGHCYYSNQNFICFGFEAGGAVSTGQLDGKFSLDSCEFTIEFFTQLRSSPSPDNHSLISMSGLELNLYSNNPSWPSFLIGSNCYDFTSCEIVDHIGIGCDFKHVAISKYCDCIKIFIDGCTIFQTGYTGVLNFTGDYLNIGSSASSCWLAGSISNFRIIKNKGLYKKDFYNCKITMPLGGYFCGVFSGNCYIDNIFYQEAGAFPTGEAIGYCGVAIFRNCSLDNSFLNTGNWFNELDEPICEIPTGNYSCIYICNETVHSCAPICFQNLFLINSCFCNYANFSYGNILAIGNSEIERVDNCGELILCDNSCISLSNVWGYCLSLNQNSVANSNVGLVGNAKLLANGFSGLRAMIFHPYCMCLTSESGSNWYYFDEYSQDLNSYQVPVNGVSKLYTSNTRNNLLLNIICGTDDFEGDSSYGWVTNNDGIIIWGSGVGGENCGTGNILTASGSTPCYPYTGQIQSCCYINGNGGIYCCFASRYNFIELKNNECVAFLGLTGSSYDSGFCQGISGAPNCNIFEPIVNAVFTGFEVFNFSSQTGLIKPNEWNHYALTVSGSSGDMYLNGCKISTTSEIYKTPEMFDSKFILNCSVYFKTNEKPFCGNIKNLKYLKDCFLYTGNFCLNEFCSTGDFFTPEVICPQNYSNLFIKSYAFDSFVDDCANLTISTSGINEVIESGLFFNSQYGGNCFVSNININKISIYLNDEFQCSFEGVFPPNLIQTYVESNRDYKIIYHPEFIFKKIYNYKYLKSGLENDSCQKIYSNLNKEIELNICNNCLNEFFVSGDCGDLKLELNLNNGFSIKDVLTKDLARNNLFLPTYEDFKYNYSYYLGNVNNSFETGVGSRWTESTIQNNCFFINCLNIISCDCIDFINNKPEIYEICINFDENRFNTNSLLTGKNIKSSESFYTVKSNDEKSFFYKGLEFKYFPITKVVYNDLEFEVPEGNANICLSGTYCSLNLNFPIAALNDSKITINSNYETIELACYNNLNLNYELFSLDLRCENSNILNYKIPKIKTQDLCSYESPNLNINVDFNIKLQKNTTFNINPYANFINNDKNYGLTNLLFLISSEINNGIANQCQYFYYDNSNPTIENGGLIDDGYQTGGYIYNINWSGVQCACIGFEYQNPDYNFFMIDLWNEVMLCSFQEPSGDGCFLAGEKISFEDINLNTIVPYKSFSGDGYNYLMPISNCLVYNDQAYFCETGLLCNYFICCNNLNFLKFNHIIQNGATGYFSMTDISGQITGCCLNFLKKSTFNYNLGNYNFKFDSSDIAQSTGTRLICINKFYAYSGIQPIFIYSNYPLLEMKMPIVSKNLNPYKYDEVSNITSGYYYYIYSVNEQQKLNLKFVSPECTYFSCVSWFDFDFPKNINLFEANLNNGMIQENASLVKFNFEPLLNENSLFYNEQTISQYICFCVGGYL